jgi:hypothetical protein
MSVDSILKALPRLSLEEKQRLFRLLSSELTWTEEELRIVNEGLHSRVEEQSTEWEDARGLRPASLKVFTTAQADQDLHALESRFETEIAPPSTWSPVRLLTRTSHPGVQALHELFQANVVQSIKTMKSRPGSGASHPTHQSIRKLVGRSVVIYYEVSEDRIDILGFGKPQGSQP